MRQKCHPPQSRYHFAFGETHGSVSELLQELLEDYALDGEWHAEGQLTLDATRARDVLARFQSNNPDLFLLHWVRFATLCGASNSSIEKHGDQLVLTHDGKWPLCQSWGQLWSQNAPPEKALAYCLWNALSIRFGEARIVFPTPQGARCLVLDGQLQDRLEDPLPGQSFQLALLPRAASSESPNLKPLGNEQRDMLEERCAFATLNLTYLGHEIPRAEPIESIFHSIFRGSETPFPLFWPRPKGKGETLPQVVRSPYLASVYVGVGDERQGLAVVLDGVAFPSSAPMGLPRLFIVLTAEDLGVDLSGERLVQSKTVASLREWLERDLDSFFRLMVRDLDTAPSGLVPYLEAFVSVRLRARDYTAAYQICRWVLRKIGAGSAVSLEAWQKDRFLNEWQRAAFLYRFALVSLQLSDKSGGRHLGEQAERVWEEAPMTETCWLPKAQVPEGKLSREERVTLCRLAVEEQTLKESAERIRTLLEEMAEQFRQEDRWGLVLYCHRWLLEVEQGDRSRGGEPKVGRRGLTLRRALVGIATIRHLRQKSTPLSEDWYEAQVYLNQALTGWRSQMERQSQIADEERATLLEILDAQIHIHLALGQSEGARRLMEVWLAEQSKAPTTYLDPCLEHLQRLKKMIDPKDKARMSKIDARMESVKKALKELRPSTFDIFTRFFRRGKS